VNEGSELLTFLGRFHPLLVHLPIGVIVLLLFFEILSRNPRHRKATCNAGYLLAVAVPTSILTALLGWMLSREGGYNPRTLDWHFWTGLLTALLCTVAATLYWLDLKKAYRVSLFGTFAMLVVASHFGGSLTHGSDYLVRYAPGPLRSVLGPRAAAPAGGTTATAEPSVFATVVLAILDRNCAGCHGPEKTKGGLRLDTFAHLTRGGDNGPAIVPGNSAESELIKRIRLPLDDDDHMPPDGKPQPSDDEVTLLAWWIDQGASENAPVSALNQTPEVRRILKTPDPGTSARPLAKSAPLDRDKALAVAVRLSGDMAVVIAPLDETQPWLVCNASVAESEFGDEQLWRLAQSPIAPNLLWLDAAGTAVTDGGLAAITNFSALTRLHLARTSISDAGMTCVATLENLEYLNLYDTGISDPGLRHLQKLPKLSQVYLWGTKASPEGATLLASARINEPERKRIEREIEALRAQLKAQHILVHTGSVQQAQPVSSAGAAELANSTCPLSGKPVDPSKKLEFEGKTYAFCCDDCLAKAKKDPKTALAKLLKP
jgi:uncharacterized membrane protein/YHS domain-containing protein/mono/diheme cytochrome c family protein